MDWGKAVARLESSIDFSRIPEAVARRLNSQLRVHVACSGGADSVFALLLVRAYLAAFNSSAELVALHFDHALRGDESDGDALFVRELCASLCVRLLDTKATWPGEGGRVTEAAARKARLAFFAEACGISHEGEALIATGHHADDVVESVLMRLSRGAGLQGLCAPREVSEAGQGILFVRPLLNWGRNEIRELLTAAAIPWREDSSNASDMNYRARLRKLTVPSWEEVADRPIRSGVCRSRRLLEEDALALDALAEQAWSELWSEQQGALSRSGLLGLPIALQRRLLARLPGGGEVAAAATDLLLKVLASKEDEGAVDARKGYVFRFCQRWLRLDSKGDAAASEWAPFALPIGTTAYLPDGAKVTFRVVEIDLGFCGKLRSGVNDDSKAVYLACGGNPPDALRVRRRKSGDAFKPNGKSSPKKLKELFIERKVGREERDMLPVFTCEERGILWVPGIPPNADCKLPAGCTTALRLTYDR